MAFLAVNIVSSFLPVVALRLIMPPVTHASKSLKGCCNKQLRQMATSGLINAAVAKPGSKMLGALQLMWYVWVDI